MDEQIQDIRKSLVEIKSKIVAIKVSAAQTTSSQSRTKLEEELEQAQSKLIGTENQLKKITASHPHEKYLEELGYLANDLHRQLHIFQNLQKQIRDQIQHETIMLEEEKEHGKGQSNGKESIEQVPLLRDNEAEEQRDSLFTLNESILLESNAGITEIQRAIYDINEIFRDLGILVSEQASMVGQVEENIEMAASRTREAAEQLRMANETRKKKSWTLVKFLLAFLFGLLMIIMVRDLLSL